MTSTAEEKNLLKMEIDELNITKITEGRATILGEGNVFYNPVQQFNRDLSISVLTTYFDLYQNEQREKQKKDTEQDVKKEGPIAGVKYENGLTILEALSATGLRSIRYAKEIPGIKSIVANDISQQAVKAIEANLKSNEVEDIVSVQNMDATTLMYLSTTQEKRFTAIDLDPYGCPSRFLDGAVQSIKDGGLLLITATDMAVLAGNTPESGYIKYGAMPLKTKACHEMALRILLKCIESHATRYGRYIKPLLSVSADFYLRVFVRIFTSPQECKKSTSKLSTVYQCAGCDSLSFHPLGVLRPNPTEKNPKQIKYCIQVGPPVNINCEFCRHRHHMGGPIWSNPIHDFDFISQLLKRIESPELEHLGTLKRITGMISVIQEELPDVPLYYAIENLCSTLKLPVIPTLKFRSAILHEGYRVSFSHACKSSIKTDAPNWVIWDILRFWAKEHSVLQKHFIDGTPLKEILSKEPSKTYQIHDIHPKANPPSRKLALARFPENPASHWGPGTRATLLLSTEGKSPKKLRNQNKKKKYQSENQEGSTEVEEKVVLKQAKLDKEEVVNENGQ